MTFLSATKNKPIDQPATGIPRCVGVIMDGNRRWARSRGLPTLQGHRKGLDRLIEFVHWAKNAGVKYVIVYAFSTENWHRSVPEVSYLMRLFKEAIRERLRLAAEERVRIKVIGQLDRLPTVLRELVREVEEATAQYEGTTLVLAISYGGRAEILSAMEKFNEQPENRITEQSFSGVLWTGGVPDPDLVIRTGGEKRLSNFLLWQIAYSELFFTDTLWPDLTEDEFAAILVEFDTRKRRFGT